MSFSNTHQGRDIQTIDLNFMQISDAIPVYLIPHAHGAILIESGPASTIPALEAGLKSHDLRFSDITDVFLTHIHLDHAGAAGWLARQGARIHVHPAGAPHMLDPEKLLSSAKRIYGDMMDTLWGEFLPVPPEKLFVIADGDVLEIDGLQIQAIETPGHANHHNVYLSSGVCFSGDIGGIRIPGSRHLRLPMPPPEFNLDIWRQSQQKLQNLYTSGAFTLIAPTHFGIFDDAEWHLVAIKKALDDVEQWMLDVMPADLPYEELNRQFLIWAENRSLAEGLSKAELEAYEAANPSWMSTAGIQRYWKKYRS